MAWCGVVVVWLIVVADCGGCFGSDYGFLLWVRFMVVMEDCRGSGVGFTIGLW